MQGFTGKYPPGNRGIKGFIGVCRSTQGLTGDYKGIQRVYRGCRGVKR